MRDPGFVLFFFSPKKGQRKIWYQSEKKFLKNSAKIAAKIDFLCDLLQNY